MVSEIGGKREIKGGDMLGETEVHRKTEGRLREMGNFKNAH